MKTLIRILLLALLISSSLFARYAYNIYPNSSGIVKYQAFKIADKTKVLDKNIDEHTDIAKLSISSRSDGDLNININIGSKYTLKKPTFLLLDSNNHEIMHKSFNDKASQINFVLSKNYIKSGINDYKFTYSGKNDKYNFLFYFKSIQITKSFIEPVITQIDCGSSSFKDKAKGFVGDDFAFVAKLSEQLPTSYHMYLAFMGVNDDGSNSGYYSQDYLMSKKDDTTYYYKKTIQKAGNNRKYKIVIKNKNGSVIDSRIGTYTVNNKAVPIANVNKIQITYPTVSLGQAEIFDIYTSNPSTKLKAATAVSTYYSDKSYSNVTFNQLSSTHWQVRMTVNSIDGLTQQKKNVTFTAYNKDGKAGKDRSASYTVIKNAKAKIDNITLTPTSGYVGTNFQFDITLNTPITYLKAVSDTGNEYNYNNAKGGLNVTYSNAYFKKVSDSHFIFTVRLNNIGDKKKVVKAFTFKIYKDKVLLATSSKKEFTVYKKEDSEKLENEMIQYLNTVSQKIKDMHLSTFMAKTTHLSRAESVVLLYEYLKSKNKNFVLPEDVSLYKNPFGDVNKNADYYQSLLTLAEFIGKNSAEPVLTHKFGVFNPLRNVTRAEFVKMVIEAYDFPLDADTSVLNSFADYNDPSIKGFEKYFAKAVKLGLIKGDIDKNGNKVLEPNRKLFLSEALLILYRVDKYPVENITQDMFLPALLTNGYSSNIGYISEIVNYNPKAAPIKIGTIDVSKAAQNGCIKLTANLDSYEKNDKNLNITYAWQATHGFFKPNGDSFKSVDYCFPTRFTKNIKVRLSVSDGLGGSDASTKSLVYQNSYQQGNIYDDKSSNIIFSAYQPIAPHSKIKEGELYDTRIAVSLKKTGLNIGIESASIAIKYNGEVNETVNVDNVAPGKNIKFVMPSIPELYGKKLTFDVTIATNAKEYTKTIYNVLYEPRYTISGKIEPDKNGLYPKNIEIDGTDTKVGEDGSFFKEFLQSGKHSISVNDNYESNSVDLTTANPTAFISINYIDTDYDNDGVVNKDDAFPYNPSISKDSDGDGYPDALNSGYTSSPIPIDKYPNDPDRYTDNTCAQVVTHAYNPNTGEEKDFATPCDVPKGWVVGKPNLVDSDGDGYIDQEDAFPNDPNEWLDTDGDGIGNNADTDDDNDGISDNDEIKYRLNPLDPNDATEDNDGDGVSNIDEINAGTDPNDSTSHPAVSQNSPKVELHKGWNLISMQQYDLSKLNKSIKSIWEFKDGSWYAYSNDKNINSKIIDAGIPLLDIANNNEGVYALVDKDINVTVASSPVAEYSIQKGWNFLGTDKNIKSSLFDNSCVSYLWQYDSINKEWNFYRTDDVDNYFGYKKFTDIKANSGFWAFGKDSCEVKVESDNNESNQIVDLKNGLVAYYKLDGNAKDSSGNGNDGVEYGDVTYVDGVFGKALKLEGYDNPGYIEIKNTDKLSFLKNFTFSFWFNIQDVYGMDGWGDKSEYGNQVILAKSGDREGINIRVSQSKDRKGYFYFWANNGRCCSDDGYAVKAVKDINKSTINLNKWHLGTLKADENYIYIYLDGVFANKVSLDKFKINTQMKTSPLRIGIGESESWYPFNGKIDNIRIYNRALNDKEIQALYNLSKNANQDQNSSKYFSVSNSIVDINQSIVFIYNYDGKNCSIDFGDGNKKTLDSCKGNYTYSYKYAEVYHPRLLSDDNEVSKLTIAVKNPTNEWVGQVTSLDNYVEPYEKTADFIKDGRMYISPDLSGIYYYWTDFNFIRPELFKTLDGDDFTLEARVKNPESEGGLSAYDTVINVLGSKTNAYAVMMGEDWATSYISVGAGTSSNKEVSALVQDFSDWRVIKLKVKNQTLSVYSDNKLIYSMQYEGSVGSILGLHFSFKGSGSVDWVKVYDATDKLIYDKDF